MDLIITRSYQFHRLCEVVRMLSRPPSYPFEIARSSTFHIFDALPR
jgi:hypothetical protein